MPDDFMAGVSALAGLTIEPASPMTLEGDSAALWAVDIQTDPDAKLEAVHLTRLSADGATLDSRELTDLDRVDVEGGLTAGPIDGHFSISHRCRVTFTAQGTTAAYDVRRFRVYWKGELTAKKGG